MKKFIRLEDDRYLAVSEIWLMSAEQRTISNITNGFIYITDKSRNTYIYNRWDCLEIAKEQLRKLVYNLNSEYRWQENDQ